MNQLRVLSLTALLLMLASRLPGQDLTDHAWDAQVVACNEGTIAFSVARAYRHPDYFSGDQWQFVGWYNVDPGKCTEIGRVESYAPGGIFLKDPLTLLAFAFTDSTGAWGAIKLSPGTKAFHPTNQQFCVQSAGFSYQGKGSDPPRECNGAQGYFPIPASYEYTGPLYPYSTMSGSDLVSGKLHVKLGPNDRAIPLGKQTSSGGASQSSSGAGSSQSNGDASPSLCGKVSCWDLFLQGLAQAARDNEAQRAAANANHNPPPPQPSTNLPPPAPRAAAPRPPVDDPIGQGGFITHPDSPAPAPDAFRSPASASDRAKSLQWVRDDMPAYVEASKTGFAAFKKGDAQLSQGYRMWDSLVKPAPAKGCWVVQGATATTLSCLLSERADLDDLRSYYTELTKDIAASLPRDWKTQAEPPFGGDLPNQSYQSSSGAHLEVWIARAASGAVYEIHFQLVSAH